MFCQIIVDTLYLCSNMYNCIKYTKRFKIGFMQMTGNKAHKNIYKHNKILKSMLLTANSNDTNKIMIQKEVICRIILPYLFI